MTKRLDRIPDWGVKQGYGPYLACWGCGTGTCSFIQHACCSLRLSRPSERASRLLGARCGNTDILVAHHLPDDFACSTSCMRGRHTESHLAHVSHSLHSSCIYNWLQPTVFRIRPREDVTWYVCHICRRTVCFETRAVAGTQSWSIAFAARHHRCWGMGIEHGLGTGLIHNESFPFFFEGSRPVLGPPPVCL